MEKIRGVWLTNVASNVLDSKDRITDAIKFLADTGFNVVFPVVWNKGLTLFPSEVMAENFGVELRIDPKYQNRDPLQEVIDAAKLVGLKVIPWFEYGFAYSYESVNTNHKHLLKNKLIEREWLAQDQTGQPLKKAGFEWMNALKPDVQNLMLSLVLEVIKKYQVDGIQGDDRFPALPSEGGYDRETKKRFREEFGKIPPLNTKDKFWLGWRADILTEFLAHLNREAKAINPEILISVASHPFNFGFQEYLQDAKTWLQRDLVDMLHPQWYRRSLKEYQTLAAESQEFTPEQRLKISPGVLMKVGNFRISPKLLWEFIQYNRMIGIQGEVFFFYEGLRDESDTLAKVLCNQNYAEFFLICRGHRSPDVTKIQQLLQHQGYQVGCIDGDFGARTEAAVKAFQRANHLPVDGIVSPITLAKLQ